MPPLFKRKTFCILVCLAAALLIAYTLPQELVDNVPMVRAATIINGVLIGAFLTFAGFVTWNPMMKMRIHPLMRGAALAAFVHLDYTIYTWPDPPLFWKTMIIAAVFGAVVDMMATQLFGEGEMLLEGMTR
ncbi:hypothetical protein KJ996_00835 [Patescibacteria group bacterium]|nr:hypothetical protein [Patescibacteria group bacterium]